MAEEPILRQLLVAMERRYRKQLEKAEEKGGVVGNRYPFQTHLAIEVLLAKAVREKLPVALVCGGLPEGFYDQDLQLQFGACAKAGVPVKVAVWNDTPSVVPDWLRRLAQEHRGAFELRWSGKLGEVGERLPHFLVVGKDHYRQEAVHRDLTNEAFSGFSPEVPARIAFQDAEGAGRLLDLFGLVWDACHPLDVAA